jgi:hypothetical protein
MNNTTFKIGDWVTYEGRTGEIVEIKTRTGGTEQTRARVRWNLTGRNLRTWIRIPALLLTQKPIV